MSLGHVCLPQIKHNTAVETVVNAVMHSHAIEAGEVQKLTPAGYCFPSLTM